MKKYVLAILILMLSSCSSLYQDNCNDCCKTNYRLTTRNGGGKGFNTITMQSYNNCRFELKAEGNGDNKLNPYIGKSSNFDALAHAISQIEAGNLKGSWLDTCKMKIVYWLADDNTLNNAFIEINSADDPLIFR